jgi:hypothetical protein
LKPRAATITSVQSSVISVRVLNREGFGILQRIILVRLQLIIFFANLSFAHSDAVRLRRSLTLASSGREYIVRVRLVVRARGRENYNIYSYIFNSLLVFYVLTVCV